MNEKTTTLRLRRVRFKNGKTIEVLRQRSDGDVASRLRASTANSIAGSDSEIVGFALVVWYADGHCFPASHNGPNSPLPAGHVAQYTKDILLAELAAQWAGE